MVKILIDIIKANKYLNLKKFILYLIIDIKLNLSATPVLICFNIGYLLIVANK